MRNANVKGRAGLSAARLISACALLSMAGAAPAGGEAGPIGLRDQGFFMVGARPRQMMVPGPDGRPAPGTIVEGQMAVGFQLPAKRRHPYPVVLVHGGGSQATDWMGTPDGRDGVLDYLLAAGFDVYVVDRPGFGRSPNVRGYGELATPFTTEALALLFTARGTQFPGGGGATSREVLDFAATTEPGPSASAGIVKEDMAELLDRIGPAILITASAGGPAGWLAMAARPDKVKGVLALESVLGVTEEFAPLFTFAPALASGETIASERRPAEGPGLEPCSLQPEGRVRTVPAFAGKKILFVVSPRSIFTGNAHCTVHALVQLGADARLARLTDHGFEGNGHMMGIELNNGDIARKLLIPWLASIK